MLKENNTNKIHNTFILKKKRKKGKYNIFICAMFYI